MQVVSGGPKPRSEESEEQSRVSRMQASSRRRWELTKHPESSLALSFSLTTERGVWDGRILASSVRSSPTSSFPRYNSKETKHR